MFDPDAAYIVVKSDNDGKWARTSKKRKKPKTFKKEELAKLLDERGLTESLLDVSSIGINPTNNLSYYRVVAFAADQIVEETAMEMVADEGPSDALPEPEDVNIETSEEPQQSNDF